MLRLARSDQLVDRWRMADEADVDGDKPGNVVPLGRNHRWTHDTAFSDWGHARLRLRPVRNYSDAQKAYYRELLILFLESQKLTVEALRNQIMEAEDLELTAKRKLAQFEMKEGEIQRDNQLTYDLFKKYLRGRTSLSNDKFYFVDRFVNARFPPALIQPCEAAVRRARAKYHCDALRDIFSTSSRAQLAEQLIPAAQFVLLLVEIYESDDDAPRRRIYKGHTVLSFGPVKDGVSLITVLQGQNSSTVATLNEDAIAGSYRLTDDQYVVLGSGYAVLTDAGFHPGSVDFVFTLILNQRLTGAQDPTWFWGNEIQRAYVSCHAPHALKAYEQLRKGDVGELEFGSVTTTQMEQVSYEGRIMTNRILTVLIVPEQPEVEILDKFDYWNENA